MLFFWWNLKISVTGLTREKSIESSTHSLGEVANDWMEGERKGKKDRGGREGEKRTKIQELFLGRVI